MRLFRNFAVVGVLVTAVCIAVVAFVGWSNGETAIDNAIRDALVTRRANRAAQVADQVDRIASEVAMLAVDRSIQNSAQKIVGAMDEVESSLGGESISIQTEGALTDWMQTTIVDPVSATGVETLAADRMLPGDTVGQAMLSFAAFDEQGLLPQGYVDQAHNAAEILSHRAEIHGFEDILLIDVDTGRVVFSSAGGADVGADLRRGYLRNSGLAEAVRLASDGGEAVAMADFSRYIPSGNVASAFFAVPMSIEGRGPAALVVRVSPEAFDRLLIDARGLAPSGLDLPVTTYVVGADRLLRTDPVAFQQAPDDYIDAAEDAGLEASALLGLRAGEAALSVPVDTPVLDQVFIREEAALDFTDDPLGQEVLMGAAQVPTELVDWAVVAQIDRSEALAPLRRFAIQEALLGVLIVILAGVALWFFNRALFRPKAQLDHVSRGIVEGDLHSRIDDQAGDEIAAASGSIDQLLDEVVSIEEQVHESERSARSVLAAVMPATVNLTDGDAKGQHSRDRRVTCCLVADATQVTASDLSTVETIREAMAYVRSLAVSHDMAIERVEGSSVLVTAPVERFRDVVAFARDSVGAGGKSSSSTTDEPKTGLLSAGIGCGDFGGRVVGDSRLHVVLWGSSISEAEEAQEFAGAGFVALSPTAVELAREIDLPGISDDSQIATIAAKAKQ